MFDACEEWRGGWASGDHTGGDDEGGRRPKSMRGVGGRGGRKAAVKCRGGNKAVVLIPKGSSLRLTLPARLFPVCSPLAALRGSEPYTLYARGA